MRKKLDVDEIKKFIDKQSLSTKIYLGCDSERVIENNIVAVHHVNENHMDNRPENLVPLCPTHHQYMHSRHKVLIENVVEEYIKSKWAVSVVGGTRALQA